MNVQSHLIIEKGQLINFKPLQNLSDYVSVEDLKDVTFSTLENTQQNALKVCSFINRTDIPIYAGAYKPMKFELVTAEHVHGKSGLDIEGNPIEIKNN